MKKGHSLKDFYIPTLTAQQKLTWNNSRVVKENLENLLQPTVCEERDTTTFEMTEKDENTFHCRLLTKGSFLSNVQLSAKENNFQGISFNNADTSPFSQEDDMEESLIMSGECSADTQKTLYEATLRQPPLALKIATTFGLVTAVVTQIHSPPLPPARDSRECESIGTLLEKSLLRCISISSLVKGNKNSVLQEKLGILADLLGFGKDFSSLMRGRKPFECNEQITHVAESMWELLGELGKSTRSTVWEHLKLIHKFGYGKTFIFPIYMLQTISHLLKALSLERDYLGGLKRFYKAMRTKEWQPSKELRSLEKEVERLSAAENKELIEKQEEYYESEPDPKKVGAHLKKIKDKRNNQKIVLYEKMLLQLNRESWLHLRLRNRDHSEEQNTLTIYQTISSIREIYSKQFFVGFVGPQNAGKSTLLNKLFDTKAGTGYRKHTTEMTTYTVADNVFAIDFPGSNSLDIEHKKFFSEYGQLANLFVVVNQYNGSVDQTLVENVKAAYSMRRQAGMSTKTLFCLNKCGLINDGQSFDENYKKDFVREIREDVEKKDFNPQETTLKAITSSITNRKARKEALEMCNNILDMGRELKEYTLKALDENDFMFTDWFKEDPSLGIYGAEEVRKRVDEYAGLTKVEEKLV